MERISSNIMQCMGAGRYEISFQVLNSRSHVSAANSWDIELKKSCIVYYFVYFIKHTNNEGLTIFRRSSTIFRRFFGRFFECCPACPKVKRTFLKTLFFEDFRSFAKTSEDDPKMLEHGIKHNWRQWYHNKVIVISLMLYTFFFIFYFIF